MYKMSSCLESYIWLLINLQVEKEGACSLMSNEHLGSSFLVIGKPVPNSLVHFLSKSNGMQRQCWSIYWLQKDDNVVGKKREENNNTAPPLQPAYIIGSRTSTEVSEMKASILKRARLPWSSLLLSETIHTDNCWKQVKTQKSQKMAVHHPSGRVKALHWICGTFYP